MADSRYLIPEGPKEEAMTANITEMTMYRKAYESAMRVFEVSKRFPPEKRYATPDTCLEDICVLEFPERS